MNYRIFLDADGIIFDFVRGVFEHYKVDNFYNDKEQGSWDIFGPNGLNKDEADFWNNIANEDFWANLRKTDEADEIVELAIEAVGMERVAVLTAPPSSNRAASICGKQRAFDRNFPYLSNRIIYTKEKYLCASESAWLVDDNDKNCRLFNEWGGNSFLFPRGWNARYAEQKTSMEDYRKTIQMIKAFKDMDESWGRALAYHD